MWQGLLCLSPFVVVLCVFLVVTKDVQKIGLVSVLKNRTVQKVYICSDGFMTEITCNPQLKLEVTKITLHAFSVLIKKILKHDRNRV